MTRPPPAIADDDVEAENQNLAEAVADSDTDPRMVPHDEVRAWLHRLANGDFDASAPEPR